MTKGAAAGVGGKKKKGGFVELHDEVQPAPVPEEQEHEHEHEQHEHYLEDVSLSGTVTGEAPAWLAAGAAVPPSRVRRGSSDETAAASTASSAFPSTDDHTSDHQQQPPPSRRPQQGPLLQTPAPPKRGGRAAGGTWLSWVDFEAGKPLGWLAVALLLASMNPSILAGLMYKSAAAEDHVYTPVSILGAANLCGLLVAVRCVGVV